MKQKLIDLAKKIVGGKLTLNERVESEDNLVEMAYQLAIEIEVTPEELETARDIKREKKLALENIEVIGNKLIKATQKNEIVEYLGDILEVVETYTAKY